MTQYIFTAILAFVFLIESSFKVEVGSIYAQERVILYAVAIWVVAHFPGNVKSLLEYRRQTRVQQEWRQFYDAFPEREQWSHVGMAGIDHDGTVFRWVDIDNDSVTIERPSGSHSQRLALSQAQLNFPKRFSSAKPALSYVGPNSYILIRNSSWGDVSYKVINQRHHTY